MRVIFFAFLCLSLHATVPAGEIPLNAFASDAVVEQFRLSPDGQSLAYIRHIEGRSYLVTQRTGSPPKSVLYTDNTKYFFQNFHWVGNKRLLVGARYPDHRRAIETMETRMIAIDSDATGLRADLLESAYGIDGFGTRKNVPQYQHAVIGKSATDPDSVLVPLDIDTPGLPDVYSLNVQTGRLTKVANNPGGIRSWIADRQGNVRIGSGWHGKEMKVIVRAPGSTRWQTVSTYLADDKEQVKTQRLLPIGFDEDPRFLYAYASHQGRDAIFRIDTADPAFPRTLIHADDRFDVYGNLIYSVWLKKYVGIDYAGEYGKRLYWDEKAKQLQAQLDNALPGMTNRIVSSSDDGMHLLISSSAINAPAQIYWLDRITGHMTELARTRPALADEKLPRPQSITFRSRDGMPLHGYLTLPSGHDVKTAGPLPLIVFPHGGPVARDIATFDIYTQFFANRGWAVLQINFRGSSGYGNDFEQAGFRRWGLEMQDDIADGVQWSITRGIADPARICIVGSSYGGYAAMMGVVKTPNLYRCAISINGISDLRDLLRSKQDYTNYEIGVERLIGEWWRDREQLRQTSPANRAGEIRTPLLLIHGKQDRIVPVSQSEDMADALKSSGNTTFRYVELPFGDHGLSREDDRIKVFTEMENFLKQHLSALGGA